MVARPLVTHHLTSEDLGKPFLDHAALVITLATEPECEIEDELMNLTQRLCFEAVATLAADGHAVVSRAEWSGYIRLDPEHWSVRVSGDDLPEVTVPRVELLEGLLAVGEEVLGLLRAAGVSSAVEHLEPFAQAARGAVHSMPRQFLGVDPWASP